MGIRIAFALLIGAGLVSPALGTDAAAQPYTQTCAVAAQYFPGCESERLEVEMSATVTPKKLPKLEMAAVALELQAVIGTGGGHPAALREAQIDFVGVAIDARGLPACRLRDLQRRRVAAARNFCREAIVGSGVSHIGFAQTGERVAAPLTLFNGGAKNGVTTLFVHSVVAAPEPVPMVGVMMISSAGKGKDKGLRTTWRLPRIVDGAGSLLDFRFTIKRRFAAGGTGRHGYVTAKCGNRGVLAEVTKLLFRNEAKTPGVASQTVLKGVIAIPCSTS
jgi:hypothetical protein